MKNSVKKIIFVCILAGHYCFSFAQEEVNLVSFYLIQNKGEVILNWTIDSGATCNGINIFQSIDSINYTEIGKILGLCGSNNSAVSYDFTDKNPTLNQTNYYKLRLGLSQFSETKTIYLKYTPPGKLIIKPNPSLNKVLIEFNNEAAENYELIITNSSGNKVYVQNNIFSDTVELNTIGWSLGIYYITLFESGGKLLKDKMIVVK
jgi:hypothetical protein